MMKLGGRLFSHVLNDRKTGFQTPTEVVKLQVAAELVEESGKDVKLTPKGRWHRTDPDFFGNEKTPLDGRLKLCRDGHEFGPSALRRSRAVEGPTRREWSLTVLAAGSCKKLAANRTCWSSHDRSC